MQKALASKGLWALIILLCLDAAIFRCGFYLRYLKPLSYAGMMRQMCNSVSSSVKHRQTDLVGLVGDSRLREGFSAHAFDLLSGPDSPRALNMAVSGSTLRVWYYLLKHVDPDCRTFKVLVLALPSYSDEDYWESQSNELADLQVLPILKATDIPEFAASFEDATARGEVLLSTLLNMYGYRRDLRDFMAKSWRPFE